jgi:transcriptional regulator with XRE-family HTH domain
MSLGQLIRERRAELGMTQEELAERIGKGQNYLSHVERGRIQRPGREIMRAIADALDLPMVDLVVASAGWADLSDIGDAAGHGPDGELDVTAPLYVYLQAHLHELSEDEQRVIIEVIRMIIRNKRGQPPVRSSLVERQEPQMHDGLYDLRSMKDQADVYDETGDHWVARVEYQRNYSVNDSSTMPEGAPPMGDRIVVTDGIDLVAGRTYGIQIDPGFQRFAVARKAGVRRYAIRLVGAPEQE